jgi:hypothetical protein
MLLATEGVALWAKVLFVVIGVGMLMPAIYNIVKSTTFQERRYDRTRNTKVKPVGQRRYRNLWVVDRDHNSNEGVTIHPPKKDHTP